MNQETIDIVARTLYGEAEVGNIVDATAIACVIMNRTRFPNWANDARRVCLQPWQFSCWNMGDPNRERILAVQPTHPWFAKCINIAADAVRCTLKDTTQRSTHYYATYIKTPTWAKGKVPVYRVSHGNGKAHVFFNDIDTPPPATPRQALEQITPIAKTRTVQAGKVATAGTLGTATIEAVQEVLDPATQSVMMIAPYMEGAKWLLLALTLIGIITMLWARIDDRKKGLR